MGAALLLAAPLSFAQAWNGPAATFAHPLGGSVSVEGPFSVYPPLPDGTGGATARGRQVARLPGGAKLAVDLSRAISPAGLKVGARVAARLSGPVGLGLLALEGLYWINEQWLKDGGVSPETGWCIAQVHCGLTIPDAGAVYSSYLTGLRGGNGAQGSQPATCEDPQNTCTAYEYRVDVANCPTGPNRCHIQGRFRSRISGSWGEWSSWAFYDQPVAVWEGDPESELVPASDADIENAVGDALSSDPAKAAEVLQAALQNGATFDDLDAGPVQASGPSSVPGPSKSSTHVGPEGTTTTVVDTTYNITYEGSTVSIVEAVTTTITHPDSTVETVTEENAPPEVDDGVGAPPEGVDPCELHPDASGCAPLGVPGPAEALPEEERPLSFEPETVGVAGVCPEPLTTTVLGKEVKIDWSWTCDALTMLRPLVLALSWLGAIFWVFGIGRATT